MKTIDVVTQALSEQADAYDDTAQAALSALCRSLLIRMRRITNEEQEKSDVMRFAEAILHGSKEHKAWLLEAAECFMNDRPMPLPKG